MAGLDVRLRGALEQRAAVHAGAQVAVDALERVLREPPVLGQLLRRLDAARDERARHVGVAARDLVARPDVDDDRLARARSRPEPESCPIADCAPWETIASSDSSQPCSSQTAAIAARTSSEVRPGAQLVDQRAGDAHRGVRGLLRAPDALELGAGLHAPALDELVLVDLDLDPGGAEVVREEDREVGRDDGAVSMSSLRAARRHTSASIASRLPALGDQVVLAERLRVDRLDRRAA